MGSEETCMNSDGAVPRDSDLTSRGGPMQDFISIIVFLAVYFAVMKFVLPAFGVPT